MYINNNGTCFIMRPKMNTLIGILFMTASFVTVCPPYFLHQFDPEYVTNTCFHLGLSFSNS